MPCCSVTTEGRFTMPANMLSLGGYKFGTSTAAYETLSRVTEYRWPAQDRIGRHPVSQFTGAGADSITLPGTIFPHSAGGHGQIDAMRRIAGQGKPLLLVDGVGRVHGYWVIDRIEETQAFLADNGVPRKQEFRVSIHYYGERDRYE